MRSTTVMFADEVLLNRIGSVGHHFNGGQPRPSTTLVRLGHNAGVLGLPIGLLAV